MKDRKVLILGGSGFLGQSIVNLLGKDAYIADIKPPNSTAKQNFIHVDVLDFSSVLSGIEKFDIIINCTGQITNPINKCFLINTLGIENIVKAILLNPQKRLIQISSVSVYGTNSYVDEETEVNPESPYATAKAFAEFLICSRLESNYTIFRIPNLYGENQAKGIFAYLLKSYNSDKKLFFNNDGTLTRYYLHVEDCANVIYNSIVHNIYGIFNIPANDKYSVIELIDFIEKQFNIKYKATFDSIKPIENIDELNCNKFLNKSKYNIKNSVHSYVKTNFKHL